MFTIDELTVLHRERVRLDSEWQRNQTLRQTLVAEQQEAYEAVRKRTIREPTWDGAQDAHDDIQKKYRDAIQAIPTDKNHIRQFLVQLLKGY